MLVEKECQNSPKYSPKEMRQIHTKQFTLINISVTWNRLFISITFLIISST